MEGKHATARKKFEPAIIKIQLRYFLHKETEIGKQSIYQLIKLFGCCFVSEPHADGARCNQISSLPPLIIKVCGK